MNTAMDVVSVVLFIVLIMYAAIKLDEAARKLRDEEERIYGERRKNEELDHHRCHFWQRERSMK